jgi:hypothetical protein
LIKFAVSKAAKRADAPDTLMFPSEFQRYLTENIYRAFDPEEADIAAARHAVGQVLSGRR